MDPTSCSILPEGKDYHIFLCYNIADEEFVDALIEYLESPEIGLKCVDHRRDFHAGKQVITNIQDFIARSWKCALIMTPAFVTSGWCAFETDIMVNMSLEEKRESVIPVLLKPCKIPQAVGILTYIDVSQSPRWRERLVDAIRRTEMHPSWAILPQERGINIRSIIRCTYFLYDGKTVCEYCCLLSDGGLSNQPPSQPHHQSDMRLKTYRGVVGSRTLIAGACTTGRTSWRSTWRRNWTAGSRCLRWPCLEMACLMTARKDPLQAVSSASVHINV
ncbi:uncharacterized protein LOC124282717 [Haliotis rubra]|uniref:uncharacterized protein LOC124282717 n=1 Tax=Haliotis rubra TaxID=36100 RepID=UPI001EE50557|nr:uncharacterized protein LOC124282717 [Haliotis rubra]